MKYLVFSLAVLVSANSAFAVANLKCGRSINFKAEFELETKPNFSDRSGNWTFSQYGKKQAGRVTAKAEEKENIVFKFTVTKVDEEATHEFIFTDFAGCYEDDDSKPASVLLFRTASDSTAKRFVKRTTCSCYVD